MRDIILAITKILFGIINIILVLKNIKFKNTLQNFSENEDENMLRNFVNKEVLLILKVPVNYILIGYSINPVYTFYLVYNNMHRYERNMKEDAFDNGEVNRIFLKSDKETDKNINFIQKILKILSCLMCWKSLASFQLISNIRKKVLSNIEVNYQSVIFTIIERVLFLILGFQLRKIFENIKIMLNTEKKVLDNEIIFGKVIFILKIILVGIRISEIINYDNSTIKQIINN